MSDPLREMVEREYAEALNDGLYHTAEERLFFKYAVDVAVRLVRRWGHAPNCVCRGLKGATPAMIIAAALHGKPFTDPRCAPPPAGEGKETT